MKIAFFTERYDPFVNGVVISIKTLRTTLGRQGHDVVIFAPAYRGHEDHDPKVVRVPSVRWLKEHYPSLSPLARNMDVLAGQGFDIVHSHHPFTMGQLAVRLARNADRLCSRQAQGISRLGALSSVPIAPAVAPSAASPSRGMATLRP